MKPSDHADLRETVRALEILRERKTNSDRFIRLVRMLTLGLVVLVGVPFGTVVLAGIVEGEVGPWPIVIVVVLAGIFYFAMRAIYPRTDVVGSALSHHFGYRRSDAEILDEQIADYERRLEFLRRTERSE